MTKKILAENLKRYRKQRGLTQAALSVKSGTRLPGISEIENAKSNPNLNTLIALAEALGVEVVDLFKKK